MNVKLCRDYYSRGYIVNWSNLSDTNGKRTIDFRPHCCKLCVTGLNQWNDFLYSCAGTAERLGDKNVPLTTVPGETYAEREGSKRSEADSYLAAATVEGMSGPKLFGLQEEQTHYFKKRYDVSKEEKALYRPTLEACGARLEKTRLATNDDASAFKGWQHFDAVHEGER